MTGVKGFDFRASEERLIGIAGPMASGSYTMGEHLADKYRFMHFSIREFLRGEALSQNRDPNRRTLLEINQQLHSEDGLAVMCLKGIERWEEREDRGLEGLVISGIRILGDAEEVKLRGGTLVYLDAFVANRYLWARHRDPNLTELTGHFAFKEKDDKQYRGVGGPTAPNLQEVRALADVDLHNTQSNPDDTREFMLHKDSVLKSVVRP